MANKNIDSFLVDHEWLKAEGKENAPFSPNQSHEQIDSLEIAFSHEPTEPKKVNAAVQKIREVIASVKRELMLGRSVKHIESNILSNLPSSIRQVVAEEVKKLSSEVGLLGNVYIEPSAFSSCEDGSKLMRNNRTASFAKKMAACSGCSYNQGGFCRMYKKALVQEVPFDQKTIQHYENHLVVAGKISPGTKLASKSDLQEAFVTPISKKSEATSILYHDESKRTQPKSKVASEAVSKEGRDIANDLSKRLSAGMQPSLFKEYVTTRYASSFKKHSDVIKQYADLVGSLGKVFVELAPFSNIEEARKFFAKNSPNVKYALSDGKKGYTSLDEKALGKKIVSSLSEIPSSEWEKNLKRAGKAYDPSELSANPIAVTKRAFLDTKQQKVASSHETFDMEREVELEGNNPKKAYLANATKSEIEASLRLGNPISSLLKHNSRISSTQISKVVKGYLETTSVVQASMFETPCETPFKINTQAKIAAKKECSGCSYNKGVLCTKLDRSFTVYANRSASAQTASEVKATEKKVAVKVDKNLEVELEEQGLDASISKYL